MKTCLPELPLSFVTPLSDVHVYEKDEAQFEVEVSRAAKTTRWLKGTQELKNDEKYKITQEANMHALVIKSAAYEDEAKYMFEAEDKRTSAKLVLQGTSNFYIHVDKRSQQLKINTYIHCTCVLELFGCSTNCSLTIVLALFCQVSDWSL